jgi:hypothetical protein
MTKKTDHEGEAREFLEAAGSQAMHFDEPGAIEAQIVQAQALIGIGHALLALTGELRGLRNDADRRAGYDVVYTS